VTGRDFRPDSVSFLRDKIKIHCGEEMDVILEVVDHIEALKSGKRRYVVSLQSVEKNALHASTVSA
jgi:hypothetical protein